MPASPSSAAPTAAVGAKTSNFSLDEKWDHSIENAIRKTSIGFVAGMLPSIILARSLVARCGIVCCMGGIGAGIAYGEARYLFDHNVAFDKRHIINVEFFKKQPEQHE